jgi:hypothetical protein
LYFIKSSFRSYSQYLQNPTAANLKLTCVSLRPALLSLFLLSKKKQKYRQKLAAMQ